MGEANDMELVDQAKQMIQAWEEELKSTTDEKLIKELQDKIYYMNYMKKTGKYLIEVEKQLNDQTGYQYIGVLILSVSKRIMNQVMCLGEDIRNEEYPANTPLNERRPFFYY